MASLNKRSLDDKSASALAFLDLFQPNPKRRSKKSINVGSGFTPTLRVGKSRVNAGQDFHPPRVQGDGLYPLGSQQIHFSRSCLLDRFGQHHIMPETVVPITHALGAISVGRVSIERVLAVFFGRGGEKRPALGRSDGCQGRARNAGQAHRIPIHLGRKPPHRRLARGDQAGKRGKSPPLQFVGDAFPDVRAEPVAQPIGRCGQVPGIAGRIQIDFDDLALEISEVAVMCGKDPGFLAADRSDRLFDAGKKRPRFSKHSASVSVFARSWRLKITSWQWSRFPVRE